MAEADELSERILTDGVATMLVLGQVLAELARARPESDIGRWVNDPVSSRWIGRFVGTGAEQTVDLIQSSFEEANRILTMPAPDDPAWAHARARREGR